MSRLSSVLRRSVTPLLVLAVAAAAAYFSGITPLKHATGTTFTAVFSSTVGLYPGSDVEVLGVSVGHVTAVTPQDGKVDVVVQLDHGQQVAANTDAVIVAPTLVSDRYVQLTKPYTTGAPLADGATITTTAVPVEIDQLYGSLDNIAKELGPEGVNKHGALSRLLKVAAANLGGNGTRINQTIGQFGKATSTLADSGDDLFATIANLDKISKTLDAHNSSVAAVNRKFAQVSTYLAGDRDDMAAAVANLGDAMVDLNRFIKENRTKLRTSVTNLIGPTQVLDNEQTSIRQTLKTIPLALQDFEQAYDVKTNTISGRADLNELTLWATNGLSAQTSPDAPPTLLPGIGDGQ